MWETVGFITIVAGGIIICVWALCACFKEDADAKAAEVEAHTEVYEYLKKQPGVVVLPKTGTLILPVKKEQDEE